MIRLGGRAAALIGVLALALLAVFAVAPERTARANHIDPPTNLTSTARTDTSITVSWTAPADQALVTHYRIRWRINTNTFTDANTIARPKSDGTSRQITGLTAYTFYNIEVHSCEDSGCSHISSSGTSLTLSTVPAAPTNLGVTTPWFGLDTQAQLRWEHPGLPSSGEFRYRSKSSQDSEWRAEVRTMGQNRARIVSDLTSGDHHDFEVRACADNSTSTCSAYAFASTLNAPSAPVLSKGAISGDSSDPLSWTTPSDGGGAITDYEYRSREKDETTWGAWATTNPMSRDPIPTEYTASRADHGKPYEYQVRAVNARGPGPASNTLLVAARPSGLGTLTATAATDAVSVTLSWTAPSNDGGKPITQYLVQWRQDSNNDWNSNGPQGSRFVSSGTSVTIPSGSVGSGLQPNTTYNFRYRAFNEDRHSFFNVNNGSIEATTAAANPPTAPQNLTPTRLSSTSARLTWDAPASDGGDAITDYLIQWRRSVAANWQGPSVLTLGMNTPLQYDVTGVDTNVDHDFRVAAVNSIVTVSNAVWTEVMLQGLGATISSPASLTEGELDGAQITVDLVGTEYVQNLTAAARHFSLNSGFFVFISAVERLSDTQAVLTLSFNANIVVDGFIQVLVQSVAHTGSGQLATSNIPVTAEAAPGTPMITRADGGAGTVTVEWIEVADADGYKVQWKSGTQNYDSSRELVITGGDTTTAVIRNLAPSTNYEVQVAATKRLAPDGTWAATVARTAAISARIDSPSSLHERDLNGARLTVDIAGTTFVTSLGSGHFSLLPAGVSGLQVASVNRVHTTRAVLTLAYTGNIRTNVDLQVVVEGTATVAGSRLTTAGVPVTASEARAHYDSDGDGLVEIYTLAQLNAMRWDPEGRGNTSFFPQHSDAYAAAFPLTSGGSVCPSGTTCSGYELMADLDFDENGNGMRDDTYNTGSGWEPIANSPGYTFDGNGHTISNLFISRSNNSALFASMISPGLIRNVGLVDASVRGRERVGALVGALASGASVTRSYVTGSVTGGASVGGLGGNILGNVSQSYADVTVTGGVRIGGLVGVLDGSGSVRDSYAAGRVRTNPAAVIGLIPGGPDGRNPRRRAGGCD